MQLVFCACEIIQRTILPGQICAHISLENVTNKTLRNRDQRKERHTVSQTGLSDISPDCCRDFLRASTRALQVNCILLSTGQYAQACLVFVK